MADHVRLFGGAAPVQGAGKLDYYAIVAGAIAALHDPSAEARQAVYEHARRVVLSQLHSRARRPSKQKLAEERRALERAIQIVETKARKRPRVPARGNRQTATSRELARRMRAPVGEAALRLKAALTRAIKVVHSAARKHSGTLARTKSEPRASVKPAARSRLGLNQAALLWLPEALKRAKGVIKAESHKWRSARAKAKAAPARKTITPPRVRIGQAVPWLAAALCVVGVATTYWFARAWLSDHLAARSRPHLADSAAEHGGAPAVAFGPPPGCDAILAATDLSACASAATERHEAGVDPQPDHTQWLSTSAGLPRPQPASPTAEATAPAASSAPAAAASSAEPTAGPTARARELTDEGIRLAKSGDLEQAMRELTNAVRADPLYADAYVHRGQTYFKLGDTEHALMDLHEAIRLDPHNAPAWRARGMTQLYKGDEDDALADLSKAIQLSEADPTRLPAVDLFYAHRIRASLCDKRKLYEREIYDLTAMIDAYWKDPLLADALRTSYREAGVATLIGSIYRLRANANVRKGAPDVAISDLSFAMQLDPQKALPLLLERARLQETLNRREQALSDYQRVLETMPANEEAKAAVTRINGQALKTD